MAGFNEVFRAIVKIRKAHPDWNIEECAAEAAKAYPSQVDNQETKPFEMEKAKEFISKTALLYEQLQIAKKEEGMTRAEFFEREFTRIAEDKNWTESERNKVLEEIDKIKDMSDEQKSEILNQYK